MRRILTGVILEITWEISTFRAEIRRESTHTFCRESSSPATRGPDFFSEICFEKSPRNYPSRREIHVVLLGVFLEASVRSPVVF